MQFAILGAGALGTILGAHLVRAGHEVIVIARGRRAAFVRDRGLIVHGLIELHERCRVVDNPKELQAAQCLIVGTKALDTRESLAALAHVKVETALSMQNGVVKDELLAETFGARAVLGAMADFSGELLQNGEVLFTRNVGFDVGELDGTLSERVKAITTAINTAGVRCTAVPDIKTREWTKFVAWAGLVPLAALTRLNTWRYLRDENGARVAVQLVREVAQLAKALQIRLMDLSPLPALALSAASVEQGIAIVQEIGKRFEASAPEHRMSTLQDIDRGTPLEVDETLGYALARARELGIPMPTLQVCYRLIKVGR